MQVLTEIRHGDALVDEAQVCDVAAFAMECLELPFETELSVTFVDNDEMADLNFQYRGIEGPTDVLSFECDNLDDGFPDVGESDEGTGDVYSLGDVIIAPDVAARQADEYGNTFEQELSLLLVHGILHLDGYDHVDDEDAVVMERMQADILARLSEARASACASGGRAHD